MSSTSSLEKVKDEEFEEDDTSSLSTYHSSLKTIFILVG